MHPEQGEFSSQRILRERHAAQAVVMRSDTAWRGIGPICGLILLGDAMWAKSRGIGLWQNEVM